MTTTLPAAPARPPFVLGRVLSPPNLVTLGRTLVAIPLGLVALQQASAALLAAAYTVYWAGDVLDGWLARRLGQETRLGAVLDIVADRVCCCVLVGGLAVLQPSLAPALAVFLVQFMVLDAVLSLAFLRWPLLSPNYFGLVDVTVYRLNWSPPAKALNTAAVVLAVAAGSLPLALLVALGQSGLKVWSARRVLRLIDALPC